MTSVIIYIITFGFVGVGLLLAGVAKKWFSIDNGPLFASLMFSPIIVYLVLSGQLLEFKGLGLEAKFREVATQRVKTTSLNTTTITLSSDSIPESTRRAEVRAFFGIGSEVVLLEADVSSTDRSIGVRDVFSVAHKIYPSLLQGNFQYLVILDESDRVLGYFRKEFFFDILRIEIEQTIRGRREAYQEARVEEQLQQTQLWDIVSNPRLRAETWGIKETVHVNTTTLEALQILTEVGLEAIVVVDGEGKYRGVVKRSDIVSDLVMNLFLEGK